MEESRSFPGGGPVVSGKEKHGGDYIERARLARMTTYTELDATLMRRTGLPEFDFSRQDERAAMGHLLGLIVERNLPATGLMISALVTCLGANDAGSGFYPLASNSASFGDGRDRPRQSPVVADQMHHGPVARAS